MKRYQIWMEGFALSGEDETAKATLSGFIEANSFQEACDKFYRSNPLYDKGTRSFWGCRLFDNEIEARQNFG